jgi:hypothetical protein
VLWLLLGFDNELRDQMREALHEEMTPGHLRQLFGCIRKERATLVRRYGSLDALRDWVIAHAVDTPAQGAGASADQAPQEEEAEEARRVPEEANEEGKRHAAWGLREEVQEEKRAAEEEHSAARALEGEVVEAGWGRGRWRVKLRRQGWGWRWQHRAWNKWGCRRRAMRRRRDNW